MTHTDYLWQSATTTKLIESLLNFHKMDVQIKKNVTVPVGNGRTRSYSSLDELLSKIKPALAKNDLILMQFLAGPDVVTMLMHKSGEFIASKIGFIAMSGVNVNELQKAGGGYTYLKRYAISALLAINADEDDDGESSVGKVLPHLPQDKLNEVKKWMLNGGTIDQVKQKYQLTKQQIEFLENDIA